MIKKENKKYLLESLSTELEKFGFDKRIHGQSFWRKTDSGRHMIHASFIDHKSDYDVTLSVSVRIDAIEEMINIANKSVSDKEKIKTSTFGCELGNIKSRVQKRYSIFDGENISEIVKQMMNDVEKIAFPYIKKYSNPETLLETLLKDDSDVWLLSPFHYHRAQVAVALAILLCDDRLDMIIERERALLEERKDYGLQLFNDFIKAIDK